MAKIETPKAKTQYIPAFAKWVEERSKMSEDEIFALEAETQGLTTAKKLKVKEPTAVQQITFSQWAEERSRMTEDEIFAIEAEIQGLKEVTPLEEFKAFAEAWKGITKEEIYGFIDERQKELELEARAEFLKKGKKPGVPPQVQPTEKPAEPVTPVEKPKVPPQVQPTEKPDLLIHRTPYPKWWNDEGIAKISLTSPGSQMVITARGDYSLYIATIVLTVSGECDISFTFGSAGASGSMDLGGTDEPRGMVIAMGNSPTPCGSGSFMITATSTDPVSIGGYVSYYLWKKGAE